jgi:hypothetical protein
VSESLVAEKARVTLGFNMVGSWGKLGFQISKDSDTGLSPSVGGGGRRRNIGGRLLVEPLLKAVEGVDAALELGGGGAPLQLQLPRVHHGAEDGEAPGTNVLATVLQAPEQKEERHKHVLATVFQARQSTSSSGGWRGYGHQCPGNRASGP